MLEWIYMRGPMALIKVSDRQIHIVKTNRIMEKFFKTKAGNFELDGEYEYRMNGQSFYFYNLYNSKPISIDGIESIQKMYRDGKMKAVYEETERINTSLESATKGSFVNPIKAMKELTEKQAEGITKSDQKFLIDYKIFDKDDVKLQNIEEMLAKKTNSGTSYRVMTSGPILLLTIVGLTVLGIMTQLNPFRIFEDLGNSLIYVDFLLWLFT